MEKVNNKDNTESEELNTKEIDNGDTSESVKIRNEIAKMLKEYQNSNITIMKKIKELKEEFNELTSGKFLDCRST